MRYGENPHQRGFFFGNFDELFTKLHGKELSYNNLLDVDAAVNLMLEFKNDAPTFAILKHNNACGLAQRSTIRFLNSRICELDLAQAALKALIFSGIFWFFETFFNCSNYLTN